MMKNEANRQEYGATSKVLLMSENRMITQLRRGPKGGYIRAVLSVVYIAS